ncbi:DUF378 domain-containing protein [Anaerolentibacter hominis]|uniref:DUF378 domain-containing protein n=1 Tax=Anaerolentibacter hominis TaxID=3079009 RepID=UPI0031B82033
MKAVRIISYILVIIGAINWLLVGAFRFDLVAWIFGQMSVISRIIYSLVGLAGIYLIFDNGWLGD